jgi:mRNA-degrading endonuclease RelE of RelBE toxin-antitoxin system
LSAELPAGWSEEVVDALRRFAEGGCPPSLEWTNTLPELDRQRLRSDLTVLLGEATEPGAPLDFKELDELLSEYAAQAGRPDATVHAAAQRATESTYTVDVRPQDLRRLKVASLAVQRSAHEVLTVFLPRFPTAPDQLPSGKVKKIAERSIWQVDLPDGFRLRYFVDEQERVVYVVYLGSHPDGAADGREVVVRSRVRRRIHGEPT